MSEGTMTYPSVWYCAVLSAAPCFQDTASPQSAAQRCWTHLVDKVVQLLLSKGARHCSVLCEAVFRSTELVGCSTGIWDADADT